MSVEINELPILKIDMIKNLKLNFILLEIPFQNEMIKISLAEFRLIVLKTRGARL